MENTYDKLFDSYMDFVTKSNISILKQFSGKNDCEDMFNYLWENEDIHRYALVEDVFKTTKCDKLAESYRKQGNEFYNKKNLTEALKFYNKSIMFSSCNRSESSDLLSEEQKDGKNLSYAFANRSAVLFEMGNHEQCLLDIERSILNRYPAILIPKLIERKAKCYVAQNKISNAKAVLIKCLDDIKKSSFFEKVSSLKENLEKLLEKCENQSNLDSPNLIYNIESKYDYLFSTKPHQVPELKVSNKTVPALSDAIDLTYSKHKGRYLMANRDIMPGEILIKEDCFSYIPVAEVLSSRCSMCLQKTATPIPCASCSTVVFCSESCHKEAMEHFHGIECAFLHSLINFDWGHTAMHAVRIIVQQPLHLLRSRIQSYNDINCNKTPISHGFNEDKLYLSNDYNTIYGLVTNQDRRNSADLFKRCAIVVFLVKLLIKSDYLNPQSSVCDVTLVGATLLRHMMNLACNADTIAEFQANKSHYIDSTDLEVAAGAFSVFSLTNHSCNPSMLRCHYGRTLVGKAIRFIPEGDEICVSYGNLYAFDKKDKRISHLKRRFYFNCSCEACLGNWPTHDEQREGSYIICPECNADIMLGKDKCRGCNKLTKELQIASLNGELISLKSLFNIMSNQIQTYVEICGKLIKGHDLEQYLQKEKERILKFILYFSKYAKSPNKLLDECQSLCKYLK